MIVIFVSPWHFVRCAMLFLVCLFVYLFSSFKVSFVDRVPWECNQNFAKLTQRRSCIESTAQTNVEIYRQNLFSAQLNFTRRECVIEFFRTWPLLSAKVFRFDIVFVSFDLSRESVELISDPASGCWVEFINKSNPLAHGQSLVKCCLSLIDALRSAAFHTMVDRNWLQSDDMPNPV